MPNASGIAGVRFFERADLPEPAVLLRAAHQPVTVTINAVRALSHGHVTGQVTTSLFWIAAITAVCAHGRPQRRGNRLNLGPKVVPQRLAGKRFACGHKV